MFSRGTEKGQWHKMGYKYLLLSTARKVPVFGFFLVRIQSDCGNKGPEKHPIQTLFTQCSFTIYCFYFLLLLRKNKNLKAI